MPQASSSTGSGSNQANARSSTTSGGRKRVSLTRIRRDASVELDEETSDSVYSESENGSDDSEDHSTIPNVKRVRSSSSTSTDQAPSRPAKYTALKSENRRIEAAVIKNKWRRSTSAAQAKIRTVLSLIERPVINANREPERRKEAQASLAALGEIMETRLPRMPFPPETKEWHFDYEAILRSNRDLERQLAAAKHSSVLARTEIAKEQKLLEEAEVELEDLEKNARAARRARVQRGRSIPQIWTASEDSKSDDADHIGLQESVAHQITSIDSQDETLPFVEELQDHLDSIESNVTQAVEMSDSLDQTLNILALLSDGIDV